MNRDVNPDALPPTETFHGRRPVDGGVAKLLRWNRGDCLGRYVVLEEVGAGGMGIVYAAYDPELDRRVALKVLQAAGDGPRDEAARLRLLREAQALARVIHPNVVAIHDVGSVDDQVFLAMEFVEGTDLGRAILSQDDGEAMGWRQILRLFLQAGRGLAAAHQAGLAHRDFKPGNVRVGDDGRVRVLDFGLALGLEPPTADTEEDLATAGLAEDSSLFDVALTQEGQVFGTPRYMAPEQHLGQRADARSDQFSFCVALWEALYGELPFAANSSDGLLKGIRSGVPEAPGSAPRDAARLQSVLARGLRFQPEKRFADLDELLDALEASAFGRRRGWVPWAVMIGLVAVSMSLWFWRGITPPPCQAAEERLVGVWDAARRMEIGTAVGGSAVASASGQWETIAALFDSHADNWQATHTEVCEATHVRQEQSTDLLDLRMACMEQRRQEFRSLTDLFLQPTPELMDDAVEVVSQLGGLLDLCAGRRFGLLMRPASDDPEQQAALTQVREGLARSWALQAARRFDEALEDLEATMLLADELDYGPLMAETSFAHAELLRKKGDAAVAGEAYLLAVARADQGHYDELRARALLGLVWSAQERHRLVSASRWLQLARSTIRRREDEPDLLTRWHQATAQLALERRNDALAIEHASRAVELSEEVFGPDHLNTGFFLATQASAFSLGARYEEALPVARRSEQIQQQILAQHDPRLSHIKHNVGIQEMQLGRLEDAQASFLEAAELGRSLKDRHTVRVLIDLASVEARLGLEEDALNHLQGALEVQIELTGAESLGVAKVLNYFGDALLELEDPGEAEIYLLRALGILDGSSTVTPIKKFTTLFNLAMARIQLGRPAEAQGLIERARRSLGEHSAWLWHIEHAEGLMELAAGRASRAVEILSGVVETLQTQGGASSLERPLVHFQLAQALAATGNDAMARQQVEIARGFYLDLGASGQNGLKKVESWLAEQVSSEAR